MVYLTYVCDAFRSLICHVAALIFLAINFARDWLASITVPPSSPLSFQRARKFAQCHHRISFNGGAFVQAKPLLA